jgi:hypothetical protein
MKGVIRENPHAHTIFYTGGSKGGGVIFNTVFKKTLDRNVIEKKQRCLTRGPICIPDFITI